jgi:hypothetical protein
MSDPRCTIGSCSAASKWVCKTDIASYYRFPYAFWLLDSGQITWAESLNEFQRGLITAGNEYHQLVERSVTPIAVPPEDLARLLKADVTILGTPVFEDKRRKPRGTRDGIDASGGALYPVEIKSHRAVLHLDRLELAFCWLLLEPRRTRHAQPKGIMILRQDSRSVRVDVLITPALLAELRRLITAVRDARKHGVRPRICGCQVCSRLRCNEVIAWVTERKDLTMIWGIGPVFAAALEAADYTTGDSPIDCDPARVAAELRDAGVKNCGTGSVEAWQLHALALPSGRPEFRPGARWPAPPPYVALDLEYDLISGRASSG